MPSAEGRNSMADRCRDIMAFTESPISIWLYAGTANDFLLFCCCSLYQMGSLLNVVQGKMTARWS